MKQTCLCVYVGATCNHRDTLLHLPSSIRQRIYLYAGVPTSTYIAYPELGPVKNDVDCEIPHNDYVVTDKLIRVCRQMRAEVEAMLLILNTSVYTDINANDGLEYLNQICPYTCSMLRNVYVHLNDRSPRYYGIYNPQPSRLDWKRIKLWQSAATNILSHANPQRLRLHVIYDATTSDQTMAVLRPLRKYPGAVLELELRLLEHGYAIGKHRDNLYALVRETALQAQGRDPDAISESFRFFDLPVEIR
ncbi:Fc.00g010100.m01.CDS01 [Cosmosporella sp. VM-42]